MEMEENIYENPNTISSSFTEEENTTAKRNLQTQPAGGDTAMKRRFRLTAVCLVLLSVLLLAAVIMLWVKFNIQTAANNQLQTENQNLTMNRDQLQTKYDNLTLERNELQKEREKFASLVSASKEGWIFFNLSIYYVSTERKPWNESRQDCIKRGADLVIINSKEEQDFVSGLQRDRWCWIGLSDSEREGEWKWVDGTSLTTKYWKSGEPDGGKNENCVANNNVWYDYPCTYNFVWVCEKRLDL